MNFRAFFKTKQTQRKDYQVIKITRPVLKLAAWYSIISTCRDNSTNKYYCTAFVIFEFH
jgi:hypothetical protein